MGRTYFCDYCEKTMKCDLSVRQKHLTGLPHLIAKAQYLQAFKDPQQILNEESKKEPCKRYLNGKTCKFGLTCFYSHYSQEQLNELQNIITKNQIKSLNTHDDTGNEDSKLQQMKKLKIWNYPSEFYDKMSPNQIPPSLQPIDLDKVSLTKVEKWG